MSNHLITFPRQAMRDSLHEHIVFLENSIQDVKNQLTRPGLTAQEYEDLQLRMATAESALEHYRYAYSTELSLAGQEPPSQPNSSGGTDQQRGPNSGPKRGSRAMLARRRALPVSARRSVASTRLSFHVR